MAGEEKWKEYLDQEVKVAKVVVAARGGVATDDFLAVYLGRNGNVLANGETQDVGWPRQRKAVTKERDEERRRKKKETDMAVFGDTTIFSLRVNSWNSFGLSTGARSTEG